MAINPLLAREIQSRWRDRRSFWLLFFLCLVLALSAFYAYESASKVVRIADLQRQAILRSDPSLRMLAYHYQPTSGELHFYAPKTYKLVNGKTFQGFEITDTLQVGLLRFSGLDFNAAPPTPSEIGRALFRLLVLGNLLIWLVMAPALAATTIARERERGLLESLQLSPMSPLSQVLARLFSILFFLSLLQIATIPTYALTFLLGGISQTEIVVSLGAIALTALWGSAFGFWLSSRAHRPLTALWSALSVIFAWSLIAFFVWNSSFWRFGAWNNQDFWIVGFYYALLVSINAHPLAAFAAWSDPNSQLRGLILTDEIQVTRAVVALALMCSVLFLGLAARNVNHVLAPPQWGARNRFVEAWKKRLEKEKAARSARQTVSQALVADLPIEKLVRFKHPILAREVRARFRLRRVGLWASLGRLALFLACGMFWAFALWNLISPDVTSFAPALLWVIWSLGVLLIALTSSASFTRERESGTWEGLRLALLSPHEIVGAKWLSPLVSTLYYLAPLWMLLPFYLLRDASLSLLLAGTCLILLSWSAVSALGLWISWRAPSPVAATGWTLGVLGAVYMLVMWLGNTWAAGTRENMTINHFLLLQGVLTGIVICGCLGMVMRAVGREKQR